ncbi:MAG: rhodanese-like domain-containing protein [Gammaproteobacteria bacterium]
MKGAFNLQVLGAGLLLAAAGALALHGQPDLEQKWEFMEPEYASRLEYREIYIDPAELLHIMNDDYIDLVIYDVRDERDWNIFHLVDAERVALEDLPGQRDRLLGLSELGVVVIVSNDEILATQAWKRLMALAKPNVYILEGGLNHWLNVYGVVEDEHERHGAASLARPDGTLRHPFKLALGARHAAARPDEHFFPAREYTPKVKLLKKVARAGGCE